MKKIIEASYLTADSAAHYRTILRYFYHQLERMRDFIAPEELFEYMHSIPSFSDYQEEQLHQQLGQLVKWNNLIARQDMTNAKTIDEYKKKRFRYQCTPYTVNNIRREYILRSSHSLGWSRQRVSFFCFQNVSEKVRRTKFQNVTSTRSRIWSEF